MIGRLRGILLEKNFTHALVECGGVGYECAISLATYGLLPEPRQEVVLFVETLLRENELSLLGFTSQGERTLYRLLVKVDGIGPKMALSALGAMGGDDLIQALRSRDVKALTRIPGIGKKTAEKMCFELSEKLGGIGGLEGLGRSTGPKTSWESDLRSALLNLGYKEEAITPVVMELREEKPDMAEAVRRALKALRR